MRFWSGSDVSDGRDHHLLAEIAGRKKSLEEKVQLQTEHGNYAIELLQFS